MNKEMKELAAWAIKTAKTAGAGGSQVEITSQRFVEISYRKQKPENIKEASTRNLGLSLFVNGRYSSMSTSDLRKNALESFIGNAVAATKLLAEDPFRTLPDPKYYAGRKKIDLGIFDPGYYDIKPEDRHKIAREVEEACYETGGDKVITATSTAYDSRSESVTLFSNGFEGASEGTVFYAGAEMTVQDEGDRRPAGFNYLVSVSRKGLPAAAEIGAEAARRTLAQMGAKKIKTETLPVIIENRVVSRVLGGFLEAMFGYNIQQKQSFLADKKERKVGSELFTIIDDPFIKGGLGSRLFDGDGLAAKKRIMVDKGVLKDFYVDWYYSRKLGWEPTTGGSSNLVIPPGKRSVKEIMKDFGRGIFITGFIGGNSNSTTGDTSVGIFGKLFDNGEFVQTIAEMNIAGNHLNFWQKLIEAADDPWPYSSERTPSLAFKDIVVSGL
jgi:PmbA protein